MDPLPSSPPSPANPPKPPSTSTSPSPSHPISPCAPCLHAPTVLHDTILLDILLYLPTSSLLRARSVSRHWHTLISTRRHLRSRCFLLPPTAPPLRPLQEWTLHPALRGVEYWGYSLHCSHGEGAGERVELGERVSLRGRRVEGACVAANMASAPAVERVGVWVAGCTMWVSCEMGVTVWMLLEGFDKLIQEKRKPTDGGRRFLWDHKTYPLAGFRILPELCDASGSGSMVVTPEFFDTQAIIAELRDGGWVRESSRVPFCFELPE